MLAGLSTGNMVGLTVVAAIFIAFALSASFLAPRRWPDFPGKNGLSVFIIVSVVLLASMLTAVEVFGVEEPEAEAGGTTATETTSSPAQQTIEVTETDTRIVLPTLKKLAPGTYSFEVKNGGKQPHNLVIEGPKAVGQTTLDTMQPGESAQLVVSFEEGTYTLYSSEDDDRSNGLTATITVG